MSLPPRRGRVWLRASQPTCTRSFLSLYTSQIRWRLIIHTSFDIWIQILESRAKEATFNRASGRSIQLINDPFLPIKLQILVGLGQSESLFQKQEFHSH